MNLNSERRWEFYLRIHVKLLCYDSSCEQEVPENKRRVSIVKGIVIARRNAGLNTTFRIRRLVAGVGVESVYPL